MHDNNNNVTTSKDTSGYYGTALAMLKDAKATVGDTVVITSTTLADTITHTGIIMPRYEHADDIHIVIKLKSGYNVGIDTRAIKSMIVKQAADANMSKKNDYIDDKSNHSNSEKKKILLLSTGGTIASRIDYRTGAVTPVLSADDLLDAVPELAEMAHIDSDVVISEYSENILPEHWLKIANRIAEIVKQQRGVDGKYDNDNNDDNDNDDNNATPMTSTTTVASQDTPALPYAGIIIAHGTDTMHYTSSFLSFALAGFPIPIVLVGAQRSSDRASSDAAINMIGAVKFITYTALKEQKNNDGNGGGGVYIAMHNGSGDDIVACHIGTRVRKNHTSKRGAFKTIGDEPAFLVTKDGVTAHGRDMKYNSKSTTPQHTDNGQHTKNIISLDKKVALVKYYPGYDPDLLGHIIDSKYRVIILEGTGLGHVGKTLYNQISRAVKEGIFVGMVSQCIDGRVSMTVYESGRDLADIGVVPLGDMIPEVALVKAMWAAGVCDTVNEIKDVMLQNVASEVTVPI